MTTRSFVDGAFTKNPGVTRYLRVEKAGAGYAVQILPVDTWLAEVLAAAGGNGVLMHVHGFNLEQHETFARHELIADGLAQHGFNGVAVSFDWPTNGAVFDYRKDRADAHLVAPQLVLDGIAVLRKAMPGITIDIMAHSMGSLVTRHAFHRVVELGKAGTVDISVGQVLLVAADIAAKSMKVGAKKSAALYAHAGRITNYYSRADEVLSLSQWYRLFQAQRLGFEGMPDGVPSGHADVYAQHYYIAHKQDWPNTASISHNWYFLDAQFYRDAALVLAGHPAATMPTRAPTNAGNQALIG
ncbi:alpha/beta hydrolase [Nioella aestuarii]|uniref:alpha/beta hydrolase n=1 Tax=Nioella aestuarii TaxID=1662864 RepID=UPI003D7F399F